MKGDSPNQREKKSTASAFLLFFFYSLDSPREFATKLNTRPLILLTHNVLKLLYLGKAKFWYRGKRTPRPSAIDELIIK